MTKQRSSSFLARVVRATDGAALPEFAIILTPLLALLMGGIDLGYQAYLRAMLQGALNDVARSGSMETVNVGCVGDTVEEQIACAIEARSNMVARNATYQIEMTNFYDFSTIGRSEKLITDHNDNGAYDEGDCFVDLNENGQFDQDAGRGGLGGADDVVFYEVTLTMPRLFPVHEILSISPNYEITSSTALRSQPYSGQAVPPTVCV